MIRIEKNKLKSSIMFFALIGLFFNLAIQDDIAQNDYTPLNIYNSPISSNLFELIDFGESQIWTSSGLASYYGNKFHLRKTSNGERYDKNDHSAAHRNLPFGTILRVVNQKNSKSTLVRINDRGPFIKKRIIDLSRAAAQDIDGLGLPRVEISGFVPKKFEIENIPNYYLAYSTSDNPAIYDKDLFDIIGDYKEFQNVFEDYQYLLDVNPSFENNLFILISAEDYNSKPSKLDYKLGYFKSFDPKRIPYNIAERDKK